jgi:hypothetical protein
MTRVPPWRHLAGWLVGCLVLLCGALAGTAGAASASTLTVTLGGTGTGTVTSAPAGISCSAGTCTGSFDPSTSVVLTAVPHAGDGFGGLLGGACSTSPCTVSMATDVQVTATFDDPPTVAITAPLNGGAYSSVAVPPAAFACTADPGSTIQSCTGKLDNGSAVPSGGALPGATGPHTLTVTATDADGSAPATATATYTVNPPPACPDVRATTNEGQRVKISLDCSDPHATTITDQIDSAPRHGTAVATSTGVRYTPAQGFAGSDSFTYQGTSANGASAIHTVTVVVLAPPTAQISAPAAGQVYGVGQSVPTRFGCGDDPAAPGIRSCVDSGGASDGTGNLNTSNEGHHTYTVTATSRDGQTGHATIDYTVVGRSPQVAITAPVDNAAYLWTAVPAADFDCLAGQGSTVQSCKATIGGQPVSDHQALPNGFGVHTLTVTATDADGLSASASATYTITSSVTLAPPVSIEAPAQGGSYRLGQVVGARYSCLALTSGPALKSCIGTVPAGHPINTRTLGTHTFSVSATNDQGTSTTETVSYAVISTSNRFAVTGVRAGRSGVARVRLRLPGPGSVKVAAIAWNVAPGASRRHVLYGLVRVGARHGGRLVIAVTPSAAGRALLRVRGARPVVSLRVSYTPTGARPRAVHLKPVRLR